MAFDWSIMNPDHQQRMPQSMGRPPPMGQPPMRQPPMGTPQIPQAGIPQAPGVQGLNFGGLISNWLLSHSGTLKNQVQLSQLAAGRTAIIEELRKNQSLTELAGETDPEKRKTMAEKALVRGYLPAQAYKAMYGDKKQMSAIELAKWLSDPNTPPEQIAAHFQNKKAGAATNTVEIVNDLSSGQAKGTGRLIRAETASRELEALEKQGLDRLSSWDSIVTSMTDNAAVKDFFMTDQGKMLNQGMENWIDNFGRDESGAQIGQNEKESWKSIYFPLAKSPDYVVNMKRRAREAVEEAFKISAGRGAEVAAQYAKSLKAIVPPENIIPSSEEEGILTIDLGL